MITKSLVQQCKIKLLDMKGRLLNQLRDQREFLANRDFSGDEGDLSVHASDENQLYVRNMRVREHLLEVEFALSRIENGQYGLCEETQEPIESERLLALPWTRLSIEGAEIREAQRRRKTE